MVKKIVLIVVAATLLAVTFAAPAVVPTESGDDLGGRIAVNWNSRKGGK